MVLVGLFYPCVRSTSSPPLCFAKTFVIVYVLRRLFTNVDGKVDQKEVRSEASDKLNYTERKKKRRVEFFSFLF